MHLYLIPFLVGVSGVITLPVLKIGHDPQAVVEGKLEVREPLVSYENFIRNCYNYWYILVKNRA